MCGIAGLIDWRAATSTDVLRAVAEAMNEALRHRGPDDEGCYAEGPWSWAIAAWRSSISPPPAISRWPRPMAVIITFNGEIYNYRAMREQLAADGRPARTRFRCGSFAQSPAHSGGSKGTSEHDIGMFAFALWDRIRVRSPVGDRLGIKPLYYAATPERVLFASQLKAFRPVPDWRPTINEDAVVGFLRHGYVALQANINDSGANSLPPNANVSTDDLATSRSTTIGAADTVELNNG